MTKTLSSRTCHLPGANSAPREKEATILYLVISSSACAETCRKGPGGDHRLRAAVTAVWFRTEVAAASRSVCIVRIYNVVLLLLLRTYFIKDKNNAYPGKPGYPEMTKKK